MYMLALKNDRDLSIFLAENSQKERKLGFVPTMGALHEGHLSLVESAKEKADAVLVSIFVNPTQFAPHEDFDSYPRPVEEDIKKLEDLGIEGVWLPSEEDIYPDGKKTDIRADSIGQYLLGGQ